MHLSANCSLKSVYTFKNKKKKSFKVLLAYSAIKSIVKMHFKDAKEVTQQKVMLFFSSFIHQNNYMEGSGSATIK